MIVKVQVSLRSSDGPQMLIYNEARDVQWEGPLTPDVKKLMHGRDKAYFEAKLIDTLINIRFEVEAQPW